MVQRKLLAILCTDSFHGGTIRHLFLPTIIALLGGLPENWLQNQAKRKKHSPWQENRDAENNVEETAAGTSASSFEMFPGSHLFCRLNTTGKHFLPIIGALSVGKNLKSWWWPRYAIG